MARTTLDIDTPVLKEVKDIQKKEGLSMGKVVSLLLAEAIAQRRVPGATPKLKWESRSMGALVDISDKDAVYGILDRNE